MGASPDRTRPFWADLRTWQALAAGIAAIGLALAAESWTAVLGSVPVLRYDPSPPLTHVAIAASPQVAFMVTPGVEQLESAFKSAGYSLERVRKYNEPVPRLRLATLPSDLPALPNASRRKKVFLSLTLPLVLEANARVAMERRMLEHVSAMRRSGLEPSPNLRSWLERLAARYDAQPDQLDLLLKRVDTVPVSLAMAQAAIESGWGTSRFALQGNAIFGQWTNAEGKGLVPVAREEGKTHKVRSFDRLSDSVSAYLLNLNTHPAYAAFRDMRQEARQRGDMPDSQALAACLEAYSELGEEYVELLQNMIRVNRLEAFDDAVLGERAVGFDPAA